MAFAEYTALIYFTNLLHVDAAQGFLKLFVFMSLFYNKGGGEKGTRQ